MKLLLIDLETTGLEGNIQPIELAAGLYDSSIKMLTKVCSTLLPLDLSDYQNLEPAREKQIEQITGIRPSVCVNFQNWQAFIVCLKALAREADFAMAHNAEYDRQFFYDGLLPDLGLNWIDSQDIPFDRKQKPLESLILLCSHYKIPIVNPHRALNDVLLLSELLKYASDSDLEYARLPRYLVAANLPYADRQKAKDAGFMWNREVANKWSKRVTEDELNSLPFSCTRI